MRTVLIICLALLTTGCVRGVRELGHKERQAFDALSQRLKDNAQPMEAAANTLSRLAAEYAELQFELETAVAHAKRLESMRAPWVLPPADMAETQRAVILYHLYEVEMAQQKLLDALIQERREATDHIVERYEKLCQLLEQSQGNLETTLGYITQSKWEHLKDFAKSLRQDVQAYRKKTGPQRSAELVQMNDNVTRLQLLNDTTIQRADDAVSNILLNAGGESP